MVVKRSSIILFQHASNQVKLLPWPGSSHVILTVLCTRPICVRYHICLIVGVGTDSNIFGSCHEFLNDPQNEKITWFGVKKAQFKNFPPRFRLAGGSFLTFLIKICFI